MTATHVSTALIGVPVVMAAVIVGFDLASKGVADGWIATDGVRQYWESQTRTERAARGVRSQLLTTDQISEAVVRLAERGYRDFVEF